MDTTIRLDLLEQGTRYEHYVELRDAFDTGIVILNNAIQLHDSKSDVAARDRLQICVDLINSRIGYLAEYAKHTGQFSDLAKDVKACGIYRTPLLAEVVTVTEETRAACQAELAEAEAPGYRIEEKPDAKDDSPKSSETSEGTSSDDAECV
jgi:hypothetical protein